MNSKPFGRLPEKIFLRDLKNEALYGIKNISIYAYKDGDSSFRVIGQVFAGKTLKKGFYLIMNIYDHDGDIIETETSYDYGGTNMIKPGYYFDGFPFAFYCWSVNWKEVSRIEIVLSDG